LILPFSGAFGVAGGGGADHGDSRRGRILRWGARASATSGISGGLVELERFVPSGRTYGVLTADYLTFFFPGLVGWKHYAIAVA